MSLEHLGWNPYFDALWADSRTEDAVPGRISAEHKQRYQVMTAERELSARVAGRFLHQAAGQEDFPAVGDWVAVTGHDNDGEAVIHAVLPRRSAFTRNEAGLRTQAQVLAANVDTAFLVSGLDHDFNLRRIERYLAAAYDSSATPVVLLNKSDVCEEIEDRRTQVEAIAMGVSIHAVSAETGDGFEVFEQYLTPGQTVVLLGSSGVGKSSIVNRLIGEERLKTHEVREWDSRGRHTTTFRQLLALPSGALVIDTPGIRELKPWVEAEDVSATFDDVEQLIAKCRFNDCGHNGEPGCAVGAALESGELDPKRWRSYVSLQKQAEHLSARRKDLARRQADKAFCKKIDQYRRQYKKLNKDGRLGRKWD